MSNTIRTRIAAVLGLFSIILSAVGLSIHGYPAIGASGEEVARWAASTNQQQFGVGIYIEALGTLLFMPFAALLCAMARDAEEGLGWLAITGFGAVVLFSGISVMDNGIWSSLLDGARHGTSPQTLASVRDIAEYIFHATLLFGGVFFVLTGYVLFRTRALPRWVGGTAVALGLGLLIPPLAIFTALLVWVWTVLVSLYLLVRPRVVVTAREHPVAMTGPAAAGTR